MKAAPACCCHHAPLTCCGDNTTGLPPEAVEALLLARADVPAAEAKDVLVQCRGVFAQKKGLATTAKHSMRLADFDSLVQVLAPL